VMVRQNVGSHYELWSMALDSGSLDPWLQTEFLERAPAFSPDGRWVAYSSDESGREEIYVRPFPGPGGRTQLSTDGGSEPAWAPEGGSLYFRSGDRLMAVSVEFGQTFRVLSQPRVVLEGQYYGYPWHRQYDVHPDGDRFLLLQTEDDDLKMTVVVNWMEGVVQRIRGP